MHFVPAVVAPEGLAGDSIWMIFQGARVLVSDDSEASFFPELKDAGWLGLPEVSRHFIGQWNGKGVYAVATRDDVQAPDGYRFEDLRRVLGQVSDELFAAQIGRAHV